MLKALRLTTEQALELSAVYDLFSSIMRGILTERQTINGQLSQGVHADQRVAPSQLEVSALGEVLPALERNMRQEGAAHLLVRGLVFGGLLSIVQVCRASVHSYPFFISATGLAAAAAGVQV